MKFSIERHFYASLILKTIRSGEWDSQSLSRKCLPRLCWEYCYCFFLFEYKFPDFYFIPGTKDNAKRQIWCWVAIVLKFSFSKKSVFLTKRLDCLRLTFYDRVYNRFYFQGELTFRKGLISSKNLYQILIEVKGLKAVNAVATVLEECQSDLYLYRFESDKKFAKMFIHYLSTQNAHCCLRKKCWLII